MFQRFIRKFKSRRRQLFSRQPPVGSADLVRRLQGGEMDRQVFTDLWRRHLPAEEDMIIGQKDYLAAHQRRFYELANAVMLFLPGRGSLCEFGVSEFSRLYRHLRPEAQLVTVDRPVDSDYPGFTPERCRRLSGCRAHFSVDLEERDCEQWRLLKAAGPFDLVLFSEVLEHLRVEPVALFRDLLELLCPQGNLYLTTPNFFRRENREKLAQGLNPQPYYPGAAENWDAHYHYREYSMKELTEAVRLAGGKVTAVYFSDCWDDERTGRAGGRSEENGNLVIIFGPAAKIDGENRSC